MDQEIRAGLARLIDKETGERIKITEPSRKNINSTVKSLIEDKISKVFFVTYLDVGFWKGSIYSYALLRPTTEMTNQWGISQMILCVIKIKAGNDSRKQSFDEKNDLDYIDRLHSVYKNRLDKLCTIFISDDENCKASIKRLAKLQSEHKVILPINIYDLNVGNPKGVIEDTLIEFFQGRDLFNFSSPLKTENYFFGRDDIISELNDAKINFQNYGLFGLRKIGKTSILYAYINRLKSSINLNLKNAQLKNEIVVDENGNETIYNIDEFIDNDPNKSFAHLLDCEGPSVYERRWNDLLKYIVDEIVASLEKNFSNEIEENQIDLTLDLDDDYSTIEAQTTFEKNLFKLKEKLNLKYLSIIFDEVEFLTFDFSPAEHWKSGEDYLKFWGSLRAVQQKNTDLFNIVVCGVNPWMVEKGTVNNIENPFFAGIKSKYVPFFSNKETIDMITNIGRYMGLSFSDEACYNLLNEFGGHPHMIRLACSELHITQLENQKYRPAKISNSYIKSNIDNLVSSCNQHLTNVMDIFATRYPNEYEMLKLVSANQQDELKDLRKKNPIDFDHLKKYNLISTENDFVDLKINAIRRFFGNSDLLDEIIIDSKDRLDKLHSKITEMEQSMRGYIKDIFIEKENPNQPDGYKKILKGVSKGSRSRVESMDTHYLVRNDDNSINSTESIKNILNPTNSPLLLSELVHIIVNNWDYFSQDFDDRHEFNSPLFNSKQAFQMQFNRLLPYRNVASHSNSDLLLESSTYRDLLNSIKLFQEIFLKK